jgi:hypothetical protein
MSSLVEGASRAESQGIGSVGGDFRSVPEGAIAVFGKAVLLKRTGLIIPGRTRQAPFRVLELANESGFEGLVPVEDDVR